MEAKKYISIESRKRDFGNHLKTQGYCRKYIGTYLSGLVHATGYMPLENLVVEILNPVFVAKLKQYLGERFSVATVQRCNGATGRHICSPLSKVSNLYWRN